jgi:hypothetical protein
VSWQGEDDVSEVEFENLLDNKIPQGVVPLERIFSRHDMYKRKPVGDQSQDVYEINIGPIKSPEMIKIGRNTSLEERKNIENLIKEYKYVFAWSYDDLNF